MTKTSSTHGGKRPGAGRKPGSGGVAQPTTVMRVPAGQSGIIRDFIATHQKKLQHEALANVMDVSRLAPDDGMALPLYTTKVAAGLPAPVDDHVETRLSPNSYLVKYESTTFCVRVKGDSMIDAGIFDNDVLVVDRSRDAQVGDIVLAVLDSEFTVKTLGRSKSGPRLIPANKDFPVIEVREGQSFEVWGVVTGSMRKFK